MAQGDRNQAQTGDGNLQAKGAKERGRAEEAKTRESATEGALARGSGDLSRGVTYGGISSPFGFMRRFMEDLDRLAGGTGIGLASAWTPQLEVFREGDDVIIRADVPGVREEDIQIELEDDVLTIAGERRAERREEDEGFFRSERSYGCFERSIRVPVGVNPDDVRAELTEGVLELRVKAPEEERRGFKIPIRGEGRVEKLPEPAEKVQATTKTEATRNKRDTH